MKLVPHSYNWDGWAQRALALIRACHIALAQAKEEQPFLQEACRILVEVGGYPLAWIGLADDDEDKSIRPVAQAGLAMGLVERLPLTWGERGPEKDPTGAAIRTAQPVFCQDIKAEPACAAWEEIATAFDLSSCFALPLSYQGRIFGALTLYALTQGTFSTDEREFLRTLSSCFSQGVQTLLLREELGRVEDQLAIKDQLADSSPYAIFIHDLEGNITSVNQAACASRGFTQKELLKLNWCDLEAPEFAAQWETQRQELVSRGEGVFTSAHLRKDGSFFPVEVHARVLDHQGKKSVLSLVLDTSERQRVMEVMQDCQERYRNIFDNVQVGVFRARLSDGKMLDCNDRLAQMFGYGNKEEFLRDFAAQDHYVESDTHGRMLENIKNGQLQNFETRCYRRDGSVFWLLCSAHAYEEQDYLEGVGNDITDLKQAKDSLHQAEEQYRTLVEQLLGRTLLFAVEHQQLSQEIQREQDLSERILSVCAEGVVGFDQDFAITLWNPAMEQLAGFPRKKVLGKNLFRFLPLLEDYQEEGPIAGSVRQKNFLDCDRLQRLTPSGPEGYFAGHYAPLLDETRQVIGGLVVIQDLTAAKRTEKVMLEQEGLLEGVMASVDEGVLVLDRNLTVLRVNPTLEKYLAPASSLLGKTCHAAIHGQDKPCEVCPAIKTLASGEPTREVVTRKKAQEDREGWLDLFAYPLKDPQTGETVAVILRAMDITSQRQAQEALRESQERLRLMVDHLPVVVGRLHPDGIVDFLEDKIERLTGYPREEFASGQQHWHEMILAEDQEQARKIFLHALGTDHSYVREYRFKTKDGKTIWLLESGHIACDSQGRALHTDIVLQDITERKQAEELRPQIEAQLRHSQRMDAIGSLAGGIAHDFNNILGVMLGYTEMAIMGLSEDNSLKRKLHQVLKAGKRGKELVSQILSFSRPTPQERRPMRVSSLAKEALTMLRATLPTTIDLKMRFEEEQDTILADPTQIHQVIINLCANAAHAMRDKGGTLEISLKAVNLDAKAASQFHGLSPGPYLRLSVKDTGQGMDKETLEKIFDPFFTTRKPGEGTGMGLAMVHGIVKAHEGAITVQSKVGKGSDFQVYLPLVEEVASAGASEKAPVTEGLGQERLLFVDDEEWLVEMWREILESLGFRVTATTSSLEALELFSRQPEAFDLVITDQTMPQLTGLELTQELLTLRPELPVILCTGFSELVTPEKAKEMGVREYIMKPLSISDLSNAINKALGKRS